MGKNIKKIKENISKNKKLSIEKGLYEAAVFIPLIVENGIEKILFEKRSAFVSQPGEICLPGGRKEPGDTTLEDTAIRETCEELGVLKEEIEVLGKVGIMTSSIGSMIHVYTGILHIKEKEMTNINKDEVESIHLVPVEELKSHIPKEYKIKITATGYEEEEHEKKVIFPAKELGLPEMYHGYWSMGYRTIFVYDLQNIKIWGLTGRIIKHFIKDYLKDS